MLYKFKNFSNKNPIFEDGDILEMCNCQQHEPHTLFGGITKNLTFRQCNLINCDVPKDATLDRCNISQQQWVPVLEKSIEEINVRNEILEKEIKFNEMKEELNKLGTDTKSILLPINIVEEINTEKEKTETSGLRPFPKYDKDNKLIGYVYNRLEKVK